MNTSNDLTSQQEKEKRCWTAGPIINSFAGKAFNRTGESMNLHDTKTYVLEVFPPQELVNKMHQSPPDIVKHLQHEGIDDQDFNKNDVSFLAHVTLPCSNENSAVDIILTSTQGQNGGVYKHEITLPRHMLCVRDSPVDTVLDSLNNALHQHNWYPPY